MALVTAAWRRRVNSRCRAAASTTPSMTSPTRARASRKPADQVEDRAVGVVLGGERQSSTGRQLDGAADDGQERPRRPGRRATTCNDPLAHRHGGPVPSRRHWPRWRRRRRRGAPGRGRRCRPAATSRSRCAGRSSRAARAEGDGGDEDGQAHPPRRPACGRRRCAPAEPCSCSKRLLLGLRRRHGLGAVPHDHGADDDRGRDAEQRQAVDHLADEQQHRPAGGDERPDRRTRDPDHLLRPAVVGAR